ncbi:MAG: hypothetical protein JJU23_09875, partial [Cyclobacteriaceae bacterium]|nr:hypothetical protein [Cyclobacteriaceae bacterium]
MSANKSLYLRHRLLTTGLLTLFLLMAWLWSSQLNDQEGERIAVIINAEKLVHELSELFINKSTTDELSKRINYDKRIVKLASHLDDLYLGKERFYFGNGKQRLSSPPTQKSEQIISKARAVVQSMIKEAASLQGFNNYQPTDKINGLKVNLATLRMEEIEHKNSMLIKSRILLILFVLSFIAAFISLIYEQKRLFKKLLPSIIRDNHECLN